MQSSFADHVHLAAHQVFQVLPQRNVVQQAAFLIRFHQEVDVAVRTILAAAAYTETFGGADLELMRREWLEYVGALR